MAMAAVITAIVTAVNEEEKKQRRRVFIELVEIAKLKMRYHWWRMLFFAYDGFLSWKIKKQ